MPIHDWSQAKSVYHFFHNAWIVHLAETLNDGVLPEGFYALGDHKIQLTEPDIVTLSYTDSSSDSGAATATRIVSPRIRFESETKPTRRLPEHRRIKVMREGSEQVVSVVEITSPSNKDRASEVRQIAEKVAGYLKSGVHALVIDILLPTKHDPRGIPGAVWDYFGRKKHTPTETEPLTLASFRSHGTWAEAFLEPTAIGRPLVSVPLYLTTDLAIAAPLEETYMTAYRRLPAPVRAKVESVAAPA